MAGICSTSERRVEYSKCTNAVIQRTATVGSFHHPWGWRNIAGSQGSLADLGTPVGHPGGSWSQEEMQPLSNMPPEAKQ